MIRANYEIAPPDSKPESPDASQLSQSEIRSNSFIFLFAGHETTANAMHYTILELAMSLRDQRRMQADIDSVVGNKPTSEWSYLTDMPRLYNSMVGAVIHEELRLIPAIIGIPKEPNGDQTVVMDGRSFVIPADTFVHVHCVATNRNPRYWPESPNEFIPERWLPKTSTAEKEHVGDDKNDVGETDGLEVASFETSGTGSLFKPIKGSYNPFSEGARACPGRRFAQVEATAVLSAVFQRYSVELDVSDWASDHEVEEMGVYARRGLYQTAIERAQKLISMSEQTITFQLKRGDHVPLRFVERGRERFLHLY
jgi:cytochrome P450